MRKELKEAKETARAEYERLSSLETYRIEGKNLKSLYNAMMESVDYVAELEEEIEKLKNKKLRLGLFIGGGDELHSETISNTKHKRMQTSI